MEYKLSDLFALQIGKTPARDEPRYWQNGRHSWISIADLSSVDKFIEETKESISDCAVKESNISMIPEGTVVMSFKLSLGKVAITKKAMYSNEAIMAFIPRAGVDISRDYLYYLLKARRWDTGGNKAVKGITLNKATLSSVKVCIHSAEEQRLIVNILDKLKSVIKRRQSQLAKLDKLVKCRFVELFGDPVEVLKLGKTQPLGTLAEDITVGYVGEAASAYTDMGVPYLRTQNVRRGYIDLSGLIYVTEDFHINNVKSKITPGDVVVSRVGVNRGMAAKIPNSLPNANIANCLIIKKTSAFIADYLVFYLNLSYGRHPQFGVSVGSAQGVINTAILKKWQVLKPDINLQKDFAAFIQHIDKLRFISGRKRVLRPSCTNELALLPQIWYKGCDIRHYPICNRRTPPVELCHCDD